MEPNADRGTRLAEARAPSPGYLAELATGEYAFQPPTASTWTPRHYGRRMNAHESLERASELRSRELKNPGSERGRWCSDRRYAAGPLLTLMGATLLSLTAPALPSRAEPVIEPQIRTLARSAGSGAAAEALRDYGLIDQTADGGWVDVWLQGPVDRSAIEALGGRVGTTAGT